MSTNIFRYSTEDVLFPPGIEVISFEELYMQKIAQETIYEYHRASFYHVFRYRGNGNYHYVKNRKIKVPDNSLLIVNCDILQRYSKRKCKGDMVLFSSTFFTDSQEKADFLSQCALFKNDYVIIPPGTESFTSSVDLYFSLMRIQLRQTKIRETDKKMLRNWLHNLLITIEREYHLQKNQIAPILSSQNYLLQFKDLLNVYYQTEKQVHFYAKELGISDKMLSRIVSAAHGITAKEYISEKILSEAVRLLDTTTLNQDEIAARLGLDSVYFVKFFRKRFNLTPAKYRQNKEN
jgi:AraC-like DNA-binding protein